MYILEVTAKPYAIDILFVIGVTEFPHGILA
jgi:hypothetical protein